MKEKTLHMIGNAHLDPVWLWQWQEGFQEVKSTFRSALDRMEEYEDFLFTSSSAAFYEWVEKSDPGMFGEIKARIAEGRWQIVGGWWIQPDCNIPGGESFVRPSTASATSKISSAPGHESATTWTPSGTTGCCPTSSRRAGSTTTCSCAPRPTRRDCQATCSGGNQTTARGC